MLSDSEFAEVQGPFPALRVLPEELRTCVCRSADPLAAQPGEVVLRPDVPDDRCIFVVAGGLRIVGRGRGGQALLLYRVNAGEICPPGATGLSNGTRAAAAGIAEGALRGIRVPPETLTALLDGAAPIRALVFEQMSRRFRSLVQLVRDLAFCGVEQRLAKALLARGGHVRATHLELAEELGSAREVISRALGNFEASGIVSLRRGEIQVRDEQALLTLAQRF